MRMFLRKQRLKVRRFNFEMGRIFLVSVLRVGVFIQRVGRAMSIWAYSRGSVKYWDIAISTERFDRPSDRFNRS